MAAKRAGASFRGRKRKGCLAPWSRATDHPTPPPPFPLSDWCVQGGPTPGASAGRRAAGLHPPPPLPEGGRTSAWGTRGGILLEAEASCEESGQGQPVSCRPRDLRYTCEKIRTVHPSPEPLDKVAAVRRLKSWEGSNFPEITHVSTKQRAGPCLPHHSLLCKLHSVPYFTTPPTPCLKHMLCVIGLCAALLRFKHFGLGSKTWTRKPEELDLQA